MPSCKTLACEGCRSNSLFSAALVLPRAFTSKAWPKLIKPRIIVLASKYKCLALAGSHSGSKTTDMEYNQAAPVPIAIRVSILLWRCLKARHALR